MKQLFRKKRYNYNKIYGQDKTSYLILGASISFSLLLFLLGFFSLLELITIAGGAITSIDFLVFGLLSCIGPVGFYNYLKAKKKKEIRDQLPDFLREISNATSSGMTVFDAIRSAAKEDFGLLTPELKQMASQLSWGISVDEALSNFAERIDTDTVRRMVLTINKALTIGGNTSAVFEAAAKEIDQINLVEQQRKSEMSMYSAVIFISFFVFLAVILIINNTIFQAIFDLQDQMAGQSIGNMRIANIDPNMIKYTFFSFVIVQSLGGGILGGFMMDGEISSGVRYGFILVLISFFIFKFFF
ncbi:MAG: type II secretion system F family protein [Candidatus Thermoplasmatota archaeon]